MNLMDALGIIEDAESKGFHNVIVNIFDMVLEDAPMFLSQYLTQLEPNLFLEFKAPIFNQVHIP